MRKIFTVLFLSVTVVYHAFALQWNGKDMPYILDEFGCIRCIGSNPAKEDSWGLCYCDRSCKYYIECIRAILQIPIEQ